MKKQKATFYILLFLFGNSAFSQESEKKSFSLSQAIEYAIANNAAVKNGVLDKEINVNRQKEVRGMGLPQVSGSFDIKDYLELPTQLLPGEVFGGAAGSFIPVKFGTKYNATGGVQATQLIFNSDYFVAIQSSSVFNELAEKNYNRSRIETIVAVSKAYYTVLVNYERVKLIDANIASLNKLLEDTKVLYANGFVEKIDIDRLQVSYNNLLTEQAKIMKLVGLTESLLKFQMTLDLNVPITLSDSLRLDNVSLLTLGKEDQISYSSRIEYSLMESQKAINEIEVKRNELAYLPNVFLYGSLTTQAQRNSFSFFDTGEKWYPISLIGVTISVPIFSGGQKHYKIVQSKLNLQKTINAMENFEKVIQLDIEAAKTNYMNALSSIEIQKTNMELSENVFNVVKIKYEQGVGSSIEILNAETALKEAQTNYFNAIYDLYIAKIDFEKASGTIK